MIKIFYGRKTTISIDDGRTSRPIPRASAKILVNILNDAGYIVEHDRDKVTVR